jgi:uncharacterized protein YecT (DUF1311 family)
MNISRSLCMFLLVAAFAPFLPRTANALSAGYATFAPTASQLATLGGASYARCLEQSGSNTGGMLNCIDSEYSRLDARLNRSYRAKIRALPLRRMMALRSDERLWLATRDEACLAELKDEREAGGSIYTVDLRTCRLEELKRRIVWVERWR